MMNVLMRDEDQEGGDYGLRWRMYSRKKEEGVQKKGYLDDVFGT